MTYEVYRAFDAAGRLLYIGSTDDVAARMRSHYRDSPWYPFHTRIELTQYPDRWSARDAESAAIAAEHPRWNVRHRSADHPDGFLNGVRSRLQAPWLRDEAEQWREWKRSGQLGGAA